MENSETRAASPFQHGVISEFRPFKSLENIVLICVKKGLTQAWPMETFLKRKFKENEIDLTLNRQQISSTLQRLRKAGKVERRHGMWRPANL